MGVIEVIEQKIAALKQHASQMGDCDPRDMFMLAHPVIVEATNAMAEEDSGFATITNLDLIEVGQKLWIPDILSEDWDCYERSFCFGGST